MQQYLQATDDGLVLRDAQVWAREKLDYVSRYMETFTTSMKGKRWRSVNYIDPFCGPGKCIIGKGPEVILGSPLTALTLTNPFSSYWFSDADAGCVTALRTRVAASPLRDRVSIVCGDANQVIPEIAEELVREDALRNTGQWSTLNLAFLDPEACQLEWESLCRLAEVNRMDLIIYYPEMALNRNRTAQMNKGGSKLDRFFGTEEWRDICRQSATTPGGSLGYRLIDLYKRRLVSLGYNKVLRADEFTTAPLIRNSRRRAPLYRLIFASKNELGHKFWKSVVSRNVYGQRQLSLPPPT